MSKFFFSNVYHIDRSGYDWLVNGLADNYLYTFGNYSSTFGVWHNYGTALETFETYFKHGFVLPTNIFPSDLERIVLEAHPDFPSIDKMHAYCRGEWVPHDEDCFGTQSEVLREASEVAAACGLSGGLSNYGVELSGRGWCVVGECVLVEASSSSEGSSSSKSASSSSSQQTTAACKHNERGPNAVYTADDCFASGLDSMEPGKCYGLNPDRGTQHGWINNNAQDSWWWVEKPCDGSDPVEQVTPGGCKHNKRGPNAVYTADDCFSSGLDNMEPGKCYALNPDRGTQYGWINNNAQDRWWWVETSCDDEEEEFEICSGGFLWDDIDNSILYKKNVSEANDETAEPYYEFPWREKEYLYDVLGRKTHDDRKTRRFLYSKGIPFNNVPNEPFVLRREASITLSNGKKCGVFGGDYGFVEGIHLHGGITCSDIKIPEKICYTPTKDILGNCQNGQKEIRLRAEISIPISLNPNKIYYVREGDGITNLYNVLGRNTVDKATEIKMCKHEVGHRDSRAMVVPNKIEHIYLYETGCSYKEVKAKMENSFEKEIESLKKRYQDLLDNADADYHKIYNFDRAPTNVECPN